MVCGLQTGVRNFEEGWLLRFRCIVFVVVGSLSVLCYGDL